MLEQIKGISEAKAGKLLNEGESETITKGNSANLKFQSNETCADGLHHGHRDACTP